MLYLKEANIGDIQKEYEVITRIPSDENGFTNEYENCSFEEFKEQILPSFINHTKGIDLKDGFVPDTNYFKDILTNDFIAQHGRPDVIITDPPRAGMHPDVINVILNAAPKRIVYVSCNPATQARDLQLMDAQYKVAAVQPVDMFPHTPHVENVVLLEKR